MQASLTFWAFALSFDQESGFQDAACLVRALCLEENSRRFIIRGSGKLFAEHSLAVFSVDEQRMGDVLSFLTEKTAVGEMAGRINLRQGRVFRLTHAPLFPCLTKVGKHCLLPGFQPEAAILVCPLFLPFKRLIDGIRAGMPGSAFIRLLKTEREAFFRDILS